MHVRLVVRVVVGPARVADTERDVPPGDEVGWAERDGVREPPLHVRDRAGVFIDALPLQVRDLPVLLRVGAGDVVLRVFPGAGDEECADRGDDGAGVEAALAVEEVHG